MHKAFRFSLVFALVATAIQAQQQSGLTAEQRQRRIDAENELEQLAVIERKVMMPMPDGVRLATDIYVPKSASPSSKVPVIFVRTPYNFNFWDIQNGVPADMTAALTAVKRGYAYVVQNERGHFFSEGNYEILGSKSDGINVIDWLAKQPWSNGKVGTTGCSSTAEWQLGVAAMGDPAFAAMNVQSFGAGVGRVRPYYEQGNWYRGGAVQMLFIPWLYGEQNQVRPMFPPNTSQDDLIRAAKSFDLAQHQPPVDWAKALWHLPEQDIITKAAGGPAGIFETSMPVVTGGAMIRRTPNDPAWYRGGLYQDDQKLNLPGLWFMTWYDVSIGPNLALYNLVRKTGSPEIANQQWAVIAPVAHCAYKRATADTVVGERSMGDARLDYDEIVYAFFDRFLKGEKNKRLESLPKVTYFTMGINKWQTSDTWPPAGAQTVTYYLSSGGKANTLYGDGTLTNTAPESDKADAFTYDPLNPVLSLGGNVCCTGNAITAGSFDQRSVEARNDVLVYTTEAFKDGVEVSGPITPTLYVSSDAKDTDFTVKVLDVYPDGRAFNLDESIQRLRYRDGYDKPLVWMEAGKVYKVTLQPLNTSNYFPPGHRLRIEVSSSNFPRFDRNLNTGGNNYDEASGVVAHNAVHHSKKYPSEVTITTVKR